MFEKGKIQSITINGNRAVIKVNNNSYSTFTPEILKEIKVGDVVSFGYIEKEKDGYKYRNFAALEKVEEGTKEFSNANEYQDQRQLDIWKGMAFNNACKLVKISGEYPNDDEIDIIFALTDKFFRNMKERWLK